MSEEQNREEDLIPMKAQQVLIRLGIPHENMPDISMDTAKRIVTSAKMGKVAEVIRAWPYELCGIPADINYLVAGIARENGYSVEFAPVPDSGIPGREEAEVVVELGEMSPEYVKPAWMGDLAALVIGAGLDVCIVGPAGLGKSRAVRELALAVDLDCEVYAFRSGMRRADVLYAKEIRNGDTVVELAPFLRSCTRPGITCVDEVFALEAEVLIGLNSLLEASQRGIDTPMGWVQRHPEHRIVLTSNTDGRSEHRIYRAPQAQDASALDRVVVLPVDYDPVTEHEVVKGALARHGVPAHGAKAQALAGFVAALRRAFRKHNIPVDVGTRALLHMADLVGKLRWPLRRAAELVCMSRLTRAELGKIEAADLLDKLGPSEDSPGMPKAPGKPEAKGKGKGGWDEEEPPF